MPDEIVATETVETPVAAAAEADWRDSVPSMPPDDEDPAALEARFGKDWKSVLGIEDEETNDGAGDSNTDAGAGDSEGDSAGAGAVASGDGVVDGAGEPGAEGVPAAQPADAELAQLAELGRQWKQAFSTDPKAALASLLNSPAFTHEDKVALFQQVQAAETARATEIDATKYEPASEFERALMPNLDWMRSGESKVAEALAVRDKDIQHTFVEAQSVSAKLDAILEYLDLKLPAHDTAAIFKHYDSSPEGTLQDAVSKVYRTAVLKAAQVEKQKRAPRPDSVRNQGSSERTVRPIRSMADAWEAAGDLMEAEA